MVQYRAHGIRVSALQARKLGRGDKIRLTHAALRGPHKVLLTKTQLARMGKAHSLRKGCDIQMSGVQVRHHKKHGGNILSDVASYARSAYDYAKPRATSAIGAIRKLTGIGVRRRKVGYGTHKKRGRGVLGSVFNMIGLGAKRRKVGGGTRRKRGRGVLGSLFNMVGLGTKRRRRRTGGAVLKRPQPISVDALPIARSLLARSAPVKKSTWRDKAWEIAKAAVQSRGNS